MASIKSGGFGSNPYGANLQRGTKSYPNGTNVPKSGPSNSRGPATGPQNNKPAPRSNDRAVNGPAYQPWAGPVRSAGTSGVMSNAANDPSFGALNTPIKSALAKRGTLGPNRMLGHRTELK